MGAISEVTNYCKANEYGSYLIEPSSTKGRGLKEVLLTHSMGCAQDNKSFYSILWCLRQNFHKTWLLKKVLWKNVKNFLAKPSQKSGMLFLKLPYWNFYQSKKIIVMNRICVLIQKIFRYVHSMPDPRSCIGNLPSALGPVQRLRGVITQWGCYTLRPSAIHVFL